MSEVCPHSERELGPCPRCGVCAHELVLNGACFYCGATEMQVSNKPAEDDFVPLENLKRRTR